MPQAYPWHEISIGEEAPETFNVVIEVPQGSKVKYELEKDSGLMEVDRVLHTSMVYPWNYGFIPQTLAEDDDPLDAIVLMQTPVGPMTLLEVRPIGILHMVDEGENDENIVCVLRRSAVQLVHQRRRASRPYLERNAAFFRQLQGARGKGNERAWGCRSRRSQRVHPGLHLAL